MQNKIIQVPGNLYVTGYDARGHVVTVSPDIKSAKLFTSATARSFMVRHGEAHSFDRATARIVDAPAEPGKSYEMESY